MRIPIIFHEEYCAVTPSESKSRGDKNRLVRDMLGGQGDRIDWISPAAMPLHWIEAVHDPVYVAQVATASVPREKERVIGFPVTESVALRAMRVPGGTWQAAVTALARGFAYNIAGGSHHARAESGAGYCVFNDLAITAVRLVAERLAARVLIVDCDVHQGDGTALLTAGRDGIATYSIHAANNFPTRKAMSTLDVPLADDTGDEAYLAALQASLVPLVEDYAPDFILYQGGVDPFVDDRLGRLALSEDGLDARDRFVARLARSRGIPLAATLGGGYGADMRMVAARHARSVLALANAYAEG